VKLYRLSPILSRTRLR